jgi:hypothetical protein
MSPQAKIALALAGLLATASPHAKDAEPERVALCRAFEGKGGDLTLVNLVPRHPAGGVVDLRDVDIDDDGLPDLIRLACTTALATGAEHCALTLTMAGGHELKFEREHIALVQAGSRVYVSSSQTVCRSHRLAHSTELAAVIKGRFVTRCGPEATPINAANTPDC